MNSQFERLTEYNNEQEILDDDITISDILGNLSLGKLEDIYFTLAAYENAEKQKRLVEFPCKVGDSLWMKTNTGKYERLVIEYFKHNKYGTYGFGYYPEWNHNTGTFSFNSIGKTVFLNKEQIEAE